MGILCIYSMTIIFLCICIYDMYACYSFMLDFVSQSSGLISFQVAHDSYSVMQLNPTQKHPRAAQNVFDLSPTSNIWILFMPTIPM